MRIRDLGVLCAVALAATGCSPSDQFWKKPDFGRKYTRMEDVLKASEPVRNLDLGNQQLTQIPDAVCKLPALERLSVRKSRLGLFPAEIGNLATLQWLDAGEAGLTNLPPDIARLGKLKTVYLSDNQLEQIPAEIKGLQAMTYLNLDRNKLTNLPPEIGQLQNLKWLHLSQNQLKVIPKEIRGLSNLQRLYLKGNPLPPEEKAAITNLLPACRIFF